MQPQCQLRVSICRFERNTAAIFVIVDSTLSVSHSQFIYNGNMVYQIGGAITAEAVNVMLYNCTFEGHMVQTVGGTLYFNWFTNVRITDCIFRNNSAFLKGSILFAFQKCEHCDEKLPGHWYSSH